MRALSLADQWALVVTVVEALRAWQPDDGFSHLESAAVVAVGRAAAPAVEMRWQQESCGQTAKFGLLLPVVLLIKAVDYDESLDPPEHPQPEDLVSRLRLAVYEPHDQAPAAAQRAWFDYLP